MSMISNTLFGRRHEPPPHHKKRDPYQDHDYGSANNRDPYLDHHYGSANNRDPYLDHHGYGPISSPPPYMPFPREQSPILNSVNPRIEWSETPELHVYTAHLPGLKRSDVRVEVDDDRVLSIICEKSVEKQEQRGGWHLVEMSSGHYVHRITLPENANVEDVKGNMEKGVLTITVPKLSRAVNRNVRTINISER